MLTPSGILLLMHYGTRQGSSQAWSILEACIELDWGSSQASPVSWPHGTGLVVVSGLLLSRLAQVAPFGPSGLLCLSHSHPGSMIPGQVLQVSSLLPILGSCLGLPGDRLEVISGLLFQKMLGYKSFRCSYIRTLRVSIASLLSDTY